MNAKVVTEVLSLWVPAIIVGSLIIIIGFPF
jgi:hypothetical protein